MKSAKASRKRKPSSAKRKAGHGGTEKIQSAKPNNERLSAFYGSGPVAGLGSAPKAKLSVSRADDPQEKEADASAERVVAGESVPSVSRAPAEEKAEASRATGPEEKPMQTAARQPEEEQVETAHRQEKEESVGTVRRQEEEEMADMLRRQGEEEEVQTVRRQEEAKEAATLQKQEEEEAQTAAFRQDETEEEETAQAQRTGAPVLSEESERKIQEMRGGGDPLPENVRAEMEEKFGADFSGVRVHTNGAASDLCREINARAFTVGHDIFFASGEFAPETKAGIRLLAHELTHVAQNGNGASPMVRRTNGNSPRQPAPNVSGDKTTGQVNKNARSITYSSIPIPAFKTEEHRGDMYNRFGTLKRDKRYSDRIRPRDQAAKWKRGIGTSGIVAALREKLSEGAPPPPGGQYVFRGPRRPGTSGPQHQERAGFGYHLGSFEDISRASSTPAWNRRGSSTASMEVDHVIEMQISGYPDNRRAHSVEFMELLERRPNQRSGTTIDRTINQLADRTWGDAAGARPALEDVIPNIARLGSRDRRARIRGTFDLIFEGYAAGEGPSINENSFWSRTQIEAGEHLGPIREAGLEGIAGDGNVMVFPTETGGVGKQFRWRGVTGPPNGREERDWLKPWRIAEKEFYTDPDDVEQAQVGHFYLELPDNAASEPVDREIIAIDRLRGARNVGSLELSRYFIQHFGKFELKHLSPVEIESVDFGSGGLVARGRVTPGLALLEGLSLDLEISDGEIRLSKTFSAGEFRIPSPFEIRNTSLVLFLSSEAGLGIEGRVEFGINQVGEGFVAAAVGTEGGFALEGEFNFDERLFGEGTQAQVRIGYRDNAWSMGGTLTIPEGRVPGVQSATIEVDYSENDGFSASGEAELDVPGVESGTLSISQSEEEGWVIGGSFNLSPDTPGIRGGTISAQVRERPGGEGYAVSARGEAQPDIPGINSNLSVAYDDGAFTAEVEADYSRGMLSGRLNAGVTNRSVGEDGQLSETAEPGNPLIVYGGGQLTIQIAPWLQGMAGVQFAPNGEITVTGEIGLPDELEIFPRREIEKSIFSIAVQAPIVPGIVAEVGGGLGAVAGIGPGVIDELRLGITYNPEREEDTTITGDAHLSVPADAGLRLSVRAGIGLGITGASVTGGLEIGGTLGIEGAAEAGVHVEWNPTSGLDLEANVSVHAQPSFTFDINGYVSVRALGFSVYDQTWELASFTFGSDYRFGINLPIHYHEGEPFDISLDDVEFEVPDIDTDELLSGLIDRIA